ncbi:hypothetical protein Q8A67_025767 [Cirrhinus molitorella]|uniref:Ribosomal protein S17 n=1 Tax=Cirrhinus molitorella TaxID=172907 RepID=A0AA88NWP7_9TELE|nr:hypothetical protein Q8A67_025767 [Cirrhinus molitorella]
MNSDCLAWERNENGRTETVYKHRLCLYQGSIRTKTVKKAARVIIENKKLRNKIAGDFCLTAAVNISNRGPVRGISIKLQEERERRDNYVPEVSALDQEIIKVDTEILKLLVFGNLSNLQVTQPPVGMNFKTQRGV